MKERRFAPRYSCDFTVAVEVEKQRYDFAARNISDTGLAVEVSQSVKQALAGLGMRMDVGDQLPLLLPEVDKERPSVLARCQVRYLRRLSQDSWLMGCQFAELDSTAQQIVEQRITRLDISSS